MKRTQLVFISLALSVTSVSATQADDMSGMDMKKPMPMGKKADQMEIMNYAGSGFVKSIDKTSGTVTLAHAPIAALNWPAMTMAFKVTDTMLYDKLVVGKKVEFTLEKQGSDYVITAVK